MRVALAATLFAAARSAAARRADQLSRPRRHAVAAGPSRPLSAAPCSSSATTATCSTTRSAHHPVIWKRGKLTLYRGGYSTPSSGSARERLPLDQKMAKKQEAQRKHMQAFVDRFRAKATKARQAQIAPEDAGQDGADRRRWSTRRCARSTFPQPAKPLSPPIIATDDVAVGYEPGQPVLSDLTLRIDNDDRIALLGANGNGKSTLAKLLAGRLARHAGRRSRRARNAQGRLFRPAPARRTRRRRQPLRSRAPADAGRAGERRCAPAPAPSAFPGSPPTTRSRHLSGGEKARLLLALATFAAPHLIILDEPTNHLDIDSRAALIEAINDYPGAVILVSHDRHLLEACADRLWLVRDGKVAPFDGDLDDYRRVVLADSGRSGASTSKATARRDPVAARRAAADKRAETAPLRKRISKAETEIAQSARASSRSSTPPLPTASCSRAIRRAPPNSPRPAPMSSPRLPRRKRNGSPPARRWRRPERARHCTVRSISPCEVLAFAGFFFAAFFFGGGLAGARRLRRAVDLLQPSVGEVIDAGPRAAQISEHDAALAFVAGADVDAAGRAGALHRLAFGHAERDAAEHRRRASAWARCRAAASAAARSPSGGRCGRQRLRGAAGCGACATGAAQRPSAPTRSSGPTGPPKSMAPLMATGCDQSGLLNNIDRLGEEAAFVLVEHVVRTAGERQRRGRQGLRCGLYGVAKEGLPG